MPASVKVEYGETFLLGEEQLVKIDEFIRNRFGSLTDFKLEYAVHRIDHALITYGTPAEVTSEQNNLAEGIETLRILGRTPSTNEPEFIDLIFSKKRGVDLTVYSNERDRALLLASDLKSYITSEVLRSKITKVINIIDSKLFFVIAFGFGTVASIVYALFSMESIPDLNNAKALDHDRLKYLVDVANSRNDTFFLMPMILVPLIFGAIGLLAEPIARLIFLPSTFYFGKQIARYNKRVAFRTQVFWVVGVGFVISLLASIAYANLP